MNALQPRPDNALALADDLADGRDYARHEKSRNTQDAYAADFRAFEAYAQRHGFVPLPAPPPAVAAWLAASAKSGLSASTIGRRACAIRHIHKLAGFAPPTDDER